MAGLHLVKHMKGLSDEEVCAQWLESPYVQFFCGAVHFQTRLPLDRSSMTRWRQRIGARRLEVLLAETITTAERGNGTGDGCQWAPKFPQMWASNFPWLAGEDFGDQPGS